MSNPEAARTERLLAALREAGEQAYTMIKPIWAAHKTPDERLRVYRAAVARLMAQHCREHGEDELTKMFEREGA